MVKEGSYYSETHEWARIEGEFAYIGISDYAQHELGDIVYVELPEVGTEVEQGEPFGSVEAVKAVEDINAPLSGEVVEINDLLEANPEFINKDAYGKGWIIKIKYFEKNELDKLMTDTKYKELVEE